FPAWPVSSSTRSFLTLLSPEALPGARRYSFPESQNPLRGIENTQLSGKAIPPGRGRTTSPRNLSVNISRETLTTYVSFHRNLRIRNLALLYPSAIRSACSPTPDETSLRSGSFPDQPVWWRHNYCRRETRSLHFPPRRLQQRMGPYRSPRRRCNQL